MPVNAFCGENRDSWHALVPQLCFPFSAVPETVGRTGEIMGLALLTQLS